MKIRLMEKADMEAVVTVHMTAFKSFFLTFLGPSFLNELYGAIVKDPTSIALVAIDDFGGIIGFVAGTSEPHGFYSRILRKRWLRFSIRALPALISRPSIIGRLIRAIRKPAETIDSQGSCELMSIAVLPERKGSGIGKTLEAEFVKIAKERGSVDIKLTTDANANDSVNHFYLSCGYSLKETFTTHEGRSMNRYVKRINSWGIG